MPEIFNPYKRLNTIQEIKLLSPEALLIKSQRVRTSFIGIPIYKGFEDYPYSLFPLTDGPISASLVEDMADLLIYYGDFEGADLIVSEGDRGGGPLTLAVASKTGIPYTLANWHSVPPDVPGVTVVQADVGFSGEGTIVISGIQPGQKVILIDDLLSSGGTAAALIKAIREAGANVDSAFFIGEKVDMGGRNQIAQEFPDVKVTSLVKFHAEIENGVTTNADLKLFGGDGGS